MTNWGATEVEIGHEMPGDDFDPTPTGMLLGIKRRVERAGRGVHGAGRASYRGS